MTTTSNAMRSRPPRRLLAAAALMATFAAGACDSPSGPSGVRGTYTLQQANGVGLPVFIGDTVVSGLLYEFELTGGELRVQSGARYVLEMNIDAYVDSVFELSFDFVDRGDWVLNAATVTFDSDSSAFPLYTGAYAGDRINVDFEGDDLLFVKN